MKANFDLGIFEWSWTHVLLCLELPLEKTCSWTQSGPSVRNAVWLDGLTSNPVPALRLFSAEMQVGTQNERDSYWLNKIRHCPWWHNKQWPTVQTRRGWGQRLRPSLAPGYLFFWYPCQTSHIFAGLAFCPFLHLCRRPLPGIHTHVEVFRISWDFHCDAFHREVLVSSSESVSWNRVGERACHSQNMKPSARRIFLFMVMFLSLFRHSPWIVWQNRTTEGWNK